MALTEREEQKLEILPNGVIQVQDILIVERDGVELPRQYHRKVIDVGADVSGESQRIQEVSATLWTPEVIAARQAEIAASESL